MNELRVVRLPNNALQTPPKDGAASILFAEVETPLAEIATIG
jgi:hypothetical protein